MHAGKSILKSFQERRPLPTAWTMHLSHNPVTIRIWGAHGKEDSQNGLNEHLGSAAHSHLPLFSDLHQTLLGEKLGGSKLHRKTEASRKHPSYSAIQVTFTCIKCPRGHKIWHASARRNNLKKIRKTEHPTHPKHLRTAAFPSTPYSSTDCTAPIMRPLCPQNWVENYRASLKK